MADEDTHHSVTDLSYGVSLYHFFQDKYFSAISDLIVAKHYRRLDTQDKNPELLLGGMYLSYGLPQKSSEIFNELLDQKDNNASASVRDRALYHLGKNYYQAGLMSKAEQSLIKITDTLNDQHEAERLYMLANIYLSNNRLDESLNLLNLIPGGTTWEDYIKFNTGTGLIKAERKDEGTSLLEGMGSNDSYNYEKKILKDKANIALAYTALNSQEYQKANVYFERVRLNGSQTDDALLGLGWAWYSQGAIEKALASWFELSKQRQSSPAKHEALIAIPYAFEKINNHDQALHEYDKAIDNYKQDIKELNHLIQSIQSGRFIEQLNPGTLGTESSLPASILKNIDPITNKYLSELFTSHKFHQSLQNYQELSYLFYTLNHWRNNLPALEIILNEKRKAYNSKLKQGVQRPKINRARQLHSQRNTLALHVQKLSKNEQTMELVSDKEREKLSMLVKARKTIKKIHNQEDLQEENDKIRLLNGLMHWDITTSYARRLWDTQKNLNELDHAIKKMNTSIKSLSNTWQQAPTRFGGFHQKIKDKKTRINQLKSRMYAALKEQEQSLSKMALNTAIEYSNRLKMYHDRALFAKARIYDSLTSPDKGSTQ
ncbi:MAG: hypothetical protein ACN4GM_00830 [Gammaproteobacteria bacterium]